MKKALLAVIVVLAMFLANGCNDEVTYVRPGPPRRRVVVHAPPRRPGPPRRRVVVHAPPRRPGPAPRVHRLPNPPGPPPRHPGRRPH